MKACRIFGSTVLPVLLMAGCDSLSHTDNGALAGGAIGAGTGALIGNMTGTRGRRRADRRRRRRSVRRPHRTRRRQIRAKGRRSGLATRSAWWTSSRWRSSTSATT